MVFIKSFVIKTTLFLILVFILPAILSQLWWQYKGEHAKSWRSARWSASGLLPQAKADDPAVIYLMAARTGRWKGGFSVHSWLVTKRAGEGSYNRYDKVGWGSPIRLNAYAPDAYWYSNPPEIIHTIKGDKASYLIPKIEAAVASYPYSNRGDYRVWPGPNSNTFIAHVLNEVPEFDAVTVSNAVGRDYLGDNDFVRFDAKGFNLQLNFKGFLGLAIGARHGIELNFLGLVAGVDLLNPGLKIPGFGRVTLWQG